MEEQKEETRQDQHIVEGYVVPTIVEMAYISSNLMELAGIWLKEKIKGISSDWVVKGGRGLTLSS